MIRLRVEDWGENLLGNQEVKQRLQRERTPSPVTVTTHSTSGSVSSLIILSSVSQSCCSAHQRHLQQFCVPTMSKLSANMLKTAWCSSGDTRAALLLLCPPAFVMFQHLLVLFSLLIIGFMTLLLLVFTRPTSERCSYFQEKWTRLQLVKHTTGTVQTRAASWRRESGGAWLSEGVEQGDPEYIRLFADDLVLLRLCWRWTRATCSQLRFTALNTKQTTANTEGWTVLPSTRLESEKDPEASPAGREGGSDVCPWLQPFITSLLWCCILVQKEKCTKKLSSSHQNWSIYRPDDVTTWLTC